VARPAWRGGLSQYSLREGKTLSVAFLARIVRFLLWLVFFAWIAWLVRRLAGSVAGRANPRASRSATPTAPKRLFRDPACGTHVAAEVSYKLEESGQVLHFCSAECRERYRGLQRRAASG
jgi:YHS domain-containing protein